MIHRSLLTALRDHERIALEAELRKAEAVLVDEHGSESPEVGTLFSHLSQRDSSPERDSNLQ